MGLILQTFKVFVWKILQHWKILFKLTFSSEIVDGYMIDEPTGRSLGKDSNILRLPRFKSHFCYFPNITAFLKACRSSSSY